MAFSCSLIVDHDKSSPDKFCVKMSVDKMQELNFKNNANVEVIGKDSAMIVCPVLESNILDSKKIFMNGLMRHNLKVSLGDPVTVRLCSKLGYCMQIDVATNYTEALKGLTRNILKELIDEFFSQDSIILCQENKFIVRKGMKVIEFVVERMDPAPYGFVDTQLMTKVNYLTDVKRYKMGEKKICDISYEDVGGYSQQLNLLRELEFPLRFPSFFKQLKVNNPHVFMHGPQGVGKLLMARAFANECNAHFVLIDESITTGASVNSIIVNIRTKLEEARNHSPSVACFNGLHKIAPRQFTNAEDDKFLIRELVTMLKQFEQDKSCVIIFIGITHIRSSVNTGVLHLFYNTRNDKDLCFEYPDYADRCEILRIHTRNLTLASQFPFSMLATATETYTSASLATLCRKVAWWVLKSKHEDSIGIEDELDDADSSLRKVITFKNFMDIIEEIQLMDSSCL